jgi:hypothetical protein
LLLWNNPQEKGVYTGKVFEYLAARRPIIALGGPDESVVKDLLNETQAGHYLSSLEDSGSCLIQVLLGIHKKLEQYRPLKRAQLPNIASLEMAKKFADLLDKVQTEALQHPTSVAARSDSAQKFTQ